MKLLLISPKYSYPKYYWMCFDGLYFQALPHAPQLVNFYLPLLIIAGLTPKGIEIKLLDEMVEDINFEEDVDLVGITVNTPQANRAYEIASEFRKRNKKVVMGGIHVSLMPQEAIQYCESVVVGRVENVWENIIRDFQNNSLKAFYHSQDIIEWDKLPLPRYDLVHYKEKYFFHPVETSIGCPHTCEFCSTGSFWEGNYFYKSVKRVIEEVKSCLSVERKPIYFIDENFIGNIKRTKELCNNLIKLNIEYSIYMPIYGGRDKELLELLAKSGCKRVFIGFESLSPINLKEVKKDGVNQPKHYKEMIETINSFGIGIQGSFIYGFDNDTKESFKQTEEFISNLSNYRGVIHHLALTPFPGTRLFKRLSEEGRIISFDWSKYNELLVIFTPKGMTPEELQNGIDFLNDKELLREFNLVSTFGRYYYEHYMKYRVRRNKNIFMKDRA
ncbi:MAG: B12-binding domain-containing radical SAM protein [Candidatus Omnitrophica bacterium]|nr:B12-binding domain-containing radical SAM protein [Candidatus Omnitrophota bacterium]